MSRAAKSSKRSRDVMTARTKALESDSESSFDEEDNDEAKRPKKKSKNGKKANVSTKASSRLRDEFLALAKEHAPDGVPAEITQRTFVDGGKYTIEELASVVNALLTEYRIRLQEQQTEFKNGVKKDNLLYQYVSEEEAVKLVGLDAAELSVYYQVQISQNSGIWIRDIKKKTNLAKNIVTKALKELMKRKLIKCEKSIAGKNKKVYMQYDLEPSKDVKGGAWYGGGEFDPEFLQALYQTSVQFVSKHPEGTTATECANSLDASQVFQVKITEDDIAYVFYSLELDAVLEQVPSNDDKKHYSANVTMSDLQLWQPGSDGLNALPAPTRVYRIKRAKYIKSAQASIPCLSCPLVSQCEDEGVVNPRTCEYLADWMRGTDPNPEPDAPDIEDVIMKP